MEIALLTPTSLRLKGKQTSLVVNPHDKASAYAGVLLLDDVKKETVHIDPNIVVIDGPGDYEIGGVKFSATRFDNDMTYSLIIDDVSILLAQAKTLVKMHAKMQDHDIVVVYVTSSDDPSVAANIATNAVLYYGNKATETVKQFLKEDVQEMNKYVITKDKLPTEVVQALLL